jgi:hypothetical protein
MIEILFIKKRQNIRKNNEDKNFDFVFCFARFKTRLHFILEMNNKEELILIIKMKLYKNQNIAKFEIENVKK